MTAKKGLLCDAKSLSVTSAASKIAGGCYPLEALAYATGLAVVNFAAVVT